MAQEASRDERVQVRYTSDEVQQVWNIGEKLHRAGYPGMRKPDGSINLSAVVRHLTLKAKD